MRFIFQDRSYSISEMLAGESTWLTESWQQAIVETIRMWYDEDKTMAIFTSGTTGTPKKIYLDKVCMKASAMMTIRYFDLRAGMTAHLGLPAQYIAGRMMIIRAILGDMDLICVAPSSTPILGNTQRLDFCAMTPLQVELSLDDPDSQLDRVSLLLIGGAPVSPYLRQRLQALTTRCYQTYGMTETITHIAVMQLNGADAGDYFETLPDVAISVDDGQLVINAPHLNAANIRTTDRVELLGDQRFRWIGRSDHIINSGGIKLQPEVIEAKLKSLIEDPFIILGVDDDLLGQCIVLVIQGSVYSVDQMADLQKGMTSNLDRFEIPKKTYFVNELKKTKTGKIIRNSKMYPLHATLDRH